MTPKEKAEELFNKYSSINIQPYSEFGDYMINEAAKQCALIAVDEILDFLYDEMVSHNTYQYWRDVKNEIELL